MPTTDVPSVAPQTVVYKNTPGCAIHLDVYRPDGSQRAPALLWIHGGALIMGSRQATAGRLHDVLLARGYGIVSIDYRLAPHTKLPEIIEDLQDAYWWMRGPGSEQFGIDADRIAVAGASAGGYLTLMTGMGVEPRPRALVSYYGYGDIDGPWYAEPDAFYRQQPLVTKEEAWRAVGASVVAAPPASSTRSLFYLYCRQNGIWPNEVAGHDPHTEPRWFDQYCPVRNVTSSYPPTLLIHGTADTDVPYAESKAMAEQLAGAGGEHRLITLIGAGHGLEGAPLEERNQVADQAAEWVCSHTR